MRTPILGAVCGESVLGMLGIALLKSTRHSALLMMVVVLAAVHTCGLCVAQQASDHGGVQPVGCCPGYAMGADQPHVVR